MMDTIPYNNTIKYTTTIEVIRWMITTILTMRCYEIDNRVGQVIGARGGLGPELLVPPLVVEGGGEPKGELFRRIV